MYSSRNDCLDRIHLANYKTNIFSQLIEFVTRPINIKIEFARPIPRYRETKHRGCGARKLPERLLKDIKTEITARARDARITFSVIIERTKDSRVLESAAVPLRCNSGHNSPAGHPFNYAITTNYVSSITSVFTALHRGRERVQVSVFAAYTRRVLRNRASKTFPSRARRFFVARNSRQYAPRRIQVHPEMSIRDR